MTPRSMFMLRLAAVILLATASLIAVKQRSEAAERKPARGVLAEQGVPAHSALGRL